MRPAAPLTTSTSTGASGSQAYARKFGGIKPDETKPASDQMVWLSRGLFEALIGFIGLAAGSDAADYRLRACSTSFITCRSARRSPPRESRGGRRGPI